MRCTAYIPMAVGLSLIVGVTVGHADLIVADADGFADGTDISTAFAGVTLSSIPFALFGLDGNVYSLTPSNPGWASTPSSVFGNNLGGMDGNGIPLEEVWYDSSFYGFRADFSNLANSVSIDIIGNNGSDFGFLEAYDSGGVLLASVVSPVLTSTQVYTATINQPSFDISYIIAGGFSGDSVHLDNLRGNVVPAPGAALLGMIGLSVVGWVRRRSG